MLFKKNIENIQPSYPCYARINPSLNSVAIYSKPDASSKPSLTINQHNEVIFVFVVKDGWARVRVNNVEGYALINQLKTFR